MKSIHYDKNMLIIAYLKKNHSSSDHHGQLSEINKLLPACLYRYNLKMRLCMAALHYCNSIFLER